MAIRFKNETVVSWLALIVSASSIFYTCNTTKSMDTRQSIDNIYQTFSNLSLANLNSWDLIHLNTLTDSYDSVSKEVHEATMPHTVQKKAEYHLKEKAFANYIFDTFEQMLYQYRQTSNNKKRKEFLKGVLDYFTGRLLQNPRLLFLWDKKGGKLCSHYEIKTVEYYDKNVTKGKIDSIGPYYLDEASVLQNPSPTQPKPKANKK